MLKNDIIEIDFLNDEKLVNIERSVNEIVRGVILSKKALCLALATIKIKKLYSQGGYNSFKDYLKGNRILLNYKTASEYASIGLILFKYRDELSEKMFNEEDGLKKLLVLEKGISCHPEKQNDYISMLKTHSYRSFVKCIDIDRRKHKKDKKKLFKNDDEKITLEPDNVDVLWIDNETIDKTFSDGISKKFIVDLKKFMQEYFN